MPADPVASGPTVHPTTMAAIAVVPGRAGSIAVRRVARPSAADLEGSGVLVRVLEVGLCGTDLEIASAEFGTAPPGDDHLVIGHEGLGRVEAVGPEAPAGLAPGRLVVATVRRPGRSVYDAIGRADLTTDDDVRERGINRLHGFLAEAYVEDAEHLVGLPESLLEVGVLLEPLSIVEKALRVADEVQARLRIWRPERAAVIGAGTIGLLTALVLRLRGVDVTVLSRRRPPTLPSELVEAIGGRYRSTEDVAVVEAARRHGPFDLILEASGHSPLAFEAADALGPNGVLVLASVTGGERTAEVPTDRINRAFVLQNKALVGTVNAAPEDFDAGVADLLLAERRQPGWLGRLKTTPIDGLDDPAAMLRALGEDETAIKAFVRVSA